jgi:endonuclease/exonuclease/phosphatase family metal-dependent hydrolase
MASLIRRFSKRFFIILNVVVCLVFLLSCLQPWLNPETFWIMGFLALAFPYLLVAVAGFVVFWLIAKPRFVFISLLSLAMAYRQIPVVFALNDDAFALQRKPETLRVMSWNIKAFAGLSGRQAKKAENAQQILAIIRKYNPDVICFQEFGQYETPGLGVDYAAKMASIGYKHHVLSKDYVRVKYNYSSGLAIFSKTPLLATKRIPFSSSPESVLYADIAFGGETIRVFNTHLQSYKFQPADYADLRKIKDTEDDMMDAGLNIFEKMKRAFRNRGAQAAQIRPLLDSCPHPEIICTDMNDVPTSYAYWQLRGTRSDAFLEAGFGIGRTFIALAPTLRIDYILADRQFNVKQFTVLPKRLSDHLALVTDLQLNQ